MKKTFYIILLLLVNTVVFGQTIEDKLTYANKIYYSNPDSSILLCDELEQLAKTDLELAEIYLLQGKYYLLKTNFEKSNELLNKASKIFKKENSLSFLAKCHSLKNILFGRISDHKKALFHSKKALELYITANDTDGQISILTNISLDFTDNQQNDSALIYLIKLKRFTNRMNDRSKYYMYQNFATYFNNVGDYEASINNYNRAFDIANKLKMVDSKSTVKMLIAAPYISLKKYKLAEKNLNESLAIAKNYDLLHETNEAYTELISLNELLGNYKKAYQLTKLSETIEKEIYNLDKISKINEIESQLKLIEKEKIITQKELELKDEQLNTVEANSKITQLFFVIGFTLLIIAFIIIVLLRTKKLNTKIQSQKLMLEEKNTEITDSINYAKRIQSAILPDLSYFKKKLPQSFVLYKPKDIVAGDFYWMKTIDKTILYAAADCTGHGVPGAMVSVVCSNALNQSVKELQSVNPAEIIEMTRTLVKENLKSDTDSVKDGMDIAFCSINLSENKLEYSGANNPLYIIRDDVLIETKGNKQPVGNHYNEKSFINHNIKIKSGDMIYTFTDGFADQFGGPKGKKFMSKQFKKLLIEIAQKPLAEQEKTLNSTFETWKGNLEQIDDVCVIGVRV